MLHIQDYTKYNCIILFFMAILLKPNEGREKINDPNALSVEDALTFAKCIYEFWLHACLAQFPTAHDFRGINPPLENLGRIV